MPVVNRTYSNDSTSPVTKRSPTATSINSNNGSPISNFDRMMDSSDRLDASERPSQKPGLRRIRSINPQATGATASTSFFGAFRWILVGIMIGCSGTAVFQSLSMSMPSLCLGNTVSTTTNVHVEGGSLQGSTPPVDVTVTQPAVHPLEQMKQNRAATKTKQQTQQKKQQQKKPDNTTNPQQHQTQRKKQQQKQQGDTLQVPVKPPSLAKQAKTKAKPTASITSGSGAPKLLLEVDDAPFVNLPPPPSLGKNESFAACLLIKDDNHWLIEWLAYHYHVMPLRNLIVVIDPESKTSPRKILRRWSSRKLMNIKIWKDEQFMPKNITAKKGFFDNNTGLMMHRVRQNNFYRTCIPTLRGRGLEWLMLVDTDEYVLPSYASGYFRNLTTQVPFGEPGSVMRLLKYQEQVTHDNHTCVYMPRFFFGAKPSPEKLVKHLVSDDLDAMSMVTQQFMFREPRSHFNGKNLLNIQRVPHLKTFGGVHHVSVQVCPNPDEMRGLNQNKHALVRAHHYLGTPEQYFFRDDPRMVESNKTFGTFHSRGTKRYDDLNRKADHEDHAAKAWIRGFVQNMGIEAAADLLDGVGKIGVE